MQRVGTVFGEAFRHVRSGHHTPVRAWASTAWEPGAYRRSKTHGEFQGLLGHLESMGAVVSKGDGFGNVRKGNSEELAVFTEPCGIAFA